MCRGKGGKRGPGGWGGGWGIGQLPQGAVRFPGRKKQFRVAFRRTTRLARATWHAVCSAKLFRASKPIGCPKLPGVALRRWRLPGRKLGGGRGGGVRSGLWSVGPWRGEDAPRRVLVVRRGGRGADGRSSATRGALAVAFPGSSAYVVAVPRMSCMRSTRSAHSGLAASADAATRGPCESCGEAGGRGVEVGGGEGWGGGGWGDRGTGRDMRPRAGERVRVCFSPPSASGHGAGRLRVGMVVRPGGLGRWLGACVRVPWWAGGRGENARARHCTHCLCQGCPVPRRVRPPAAPRSGSGGRAERPGLGSGEGCGEGCGGGCGGDCEGTLGKREISGMSMAAERC